MATDTAAGVTDRWRALYIRMRDVAAGYSNLMDDNANSRRLDREFNECQEEFRRLQIVGTEDDYPVR